MDNLTFVIELKKIIDNKIQENEKIINQINKKIEKYNELLNGKENYKYEKMEIISKEIDKLEEELIENIYLINYNDCAYNKNNYENDKDYYEFFKYWLLNDYLNDYIEGYIKQTIIKIEKSINNDIEMKEENENIEEEYELENNIKKLEIK